MKTKKTLSVILAVMMILSALPIVSLAAEDPVVTEWPTVVEEYAEVGTLMGDLTLTGGEASVPGTYSTNKDGTAVSTNKNTTQSVTLTFTPENTFLKPKSWSYSFKVKENTEWFLLRD